MTLLQKIKQDQLNARKDRNMFLAQTLTTVIGEIEKIGKDDGNRETSDIEAIKVLRKSRNAIEFTIKTMLDADRKAYTINQIEEIKILNEYIPQQYSENKLTELMLELRVDCQEKNKEFTLPIAMRYLKEYHDGYYDGKLASFVIRDLIGQS